MDYLNKQGFVLTEDERTIEFLNPTTQEKIVATRNYVSKATFIAVMKYKNPYDIRSVRQPTAEEETAVIQILKDRGVF